MLNENIFNTKTPEQAVEEKNESRGGGNYMPYLGIGENDSAVVRFLDRVPLTFYQHREWDPALKKGQGGYRMTTCIRENCPVCNAGGKPRYVGAFRVVHLDAMVSDSQGNKVTTPTEKIFIKGINTLEILTRKDKKRDITSENIDIERIGKGFDTKYMFDYTGVTDAPVFERFENDDLMKIFAPDVEVLNRLAANMKGSKVEQPIQQAPVAQAPVTPSVSSQEMHTESATDVAEAGYDELIPF